MVHSWSLFDNDHLKPHTAVKYFLKKMLKIAIKFCNIKKLFFTPTHIFKIWRTDLQNNKLLLFREKY